MGWGLSLSWGYKVFWFCWLRLAAVNSIASHHYRYTCIKAYTCTHKQILLFLLKNMVTLCSILYMSDVLRPAVCTAMHKPEMLSLARMLIACEALLHATLPTRPPTVRSGCIRLHFNKACHYLLACDVPLHHEKINAVITYKTSPWKRDWCYKLCWVYTSKRFVRCDTALLGLFCFIFLDTNFRIYLDIFPAQSGPAGSAGSIWCVTHDWE